MGLMSDQTLQKIKSVKTRYSITKTKHTHKKTEKNEQNNQSGMGQLWIPFKWCPLRKHNGDF